MSGLRYRDTMPSGELAQLLGECHALDAQYAEAADADAARAAPEVVLGETPEEVAERGHAAYEQSAEHFNQYVAGDR